MDDYGYFGEGSSGYAHYMQAHDRSHGSGGGGGGGRRGGGGDSGCLVWVVVALALGMIFAAGCSDTLLQTMYF